MARSIVVSPSILRRPIRILLISASLLLAIYVSFVVLVVCSPSFVHAQRGTQLATSGSVERQSNVQQVVMTVAVTDKKANPVKGFVTTWQRSHQSSNE